METDLKDQYVRAMGQKPGELFFQLQDDFDWLRRKWSVHKDLFQKGQEQIDLLNFAASNFFFFLNRLLFEDAMLHLCRLTDPPKSRDRANLTVRAVPDFVADPKLKDSVCVKIGEVRARCDFARKWRDRRLAHSDLLTVQQGHTGLLQPVVANDVEKAIASIGGLLDLLIDHHKLPHFMLGPDPWGAKSLVGYLNVAKQATESEHKALSELVSKSRNPVNDSI